MRRLAIFMMAVMVSVAAVQAQSIAALWNLCPKGGSVVLQSHVVADMVVVSDCDSPNMSPSLNVSVGTLESRWNRRTAFVQTPDGKVGLRLIFASAGENALHKGDLV